MPQSKIAIFREGDRTGSRITMDGKEITREEYQKELQKQKGKIVKINAVRVSHKERKE